MAKLEIDDTQLKRIIAEVETELETMLKSEASLAKAFPPAKEEESKDQDAGKMAASPEDKGQAAIADAPQAPPVDEMQPEAPVAAAPAQEPPMDPAMAPAEDPAMEPAMDHDSLKAEYCELSPEELKMHYMAAKEALFDLMGGHNTEEPTPAPEVPAAPAPEMAMKGELEAIAPNDKAKAPSKMRLEEVQPEGKAGTPSPNRLEDVYVSAKKSESEIAKDGEIETLKKSVKDHDDALGKLVDAVKMVFERPERKAVTTVAALSKPGNAVEGKTFTKSEAMAKLKEISGTPNLKKSDRELINSFCVGAVSLDKIEHLLK